MVPRFESVEPSQAAYVMVSLPENPTSGKYVISVPLNPAVPLDGWDTILRVKALLLASLACNEMTTDFPVVVVAVRFFTTAGVFELELSLPGPLWQL